MNKTKIIWGLLTCGLLAVYAPVQAQTGFDTGDISAILEDNSLRDVAARYTSVLTYFFPEEATRLGFSSANNLLNNRSFQTESQALQALNAVQNALEQINVKGLSPSKRAEHTLLMDSINKFRWELTQNRLTHDPFYYAQAVDAVYDLMLIPQDDNFRKQHTDLLSRVSALPNVLAQAKENLLEVSPISSRLAMEKAYYAYLSFDEVEKRIMHGASLANDSREESEAEETLQKAKDSLREMFDFFKKLSQEEVTEDTPDFRLGPVNYDSRLGQVYQITQSSNDLTTRVTTSFNQAQHQLFDALQPFQLSADLEDVTIVEDLNNTPQKQLFKSETTNKKPTKYTPPSANQFYAVSSKLVSPLKADKVLENITKQATTLTSRLFRNRVIPSTVPLKTAPLIPYFSFQNKYLYGPGSDTFWLRTPTGNQLAQEEVLQRDFTEPAYKLLISQEIVPGRYYQVRTAKSNIRRLFGSRTMANGWTSYAMNLMCKNGYLITDEELLFVAWQNYLNAIAALVDLRLHTLQYTYDQALHFLTEENGFSQEQGTEILNNTIRFPGEAVSYIIGGADWQKMADIYVKKTKNQKQVTAMMLQIGNVAPDSLEDEMKRVYRK